ncbi:MAG TPA: site-2 protease family protein [Candidatus Glassbacteria bacterium]|nr:site-2 protease family protein [Candidatus Glassbacteria bacterium]
MTKKSQTFILSSIYATYDSLPRIIERKPIRMEQWLIVLPVLLFSVVVHECAHAIAAERAGDATARLLGRITLNPVPHIDPVGSILVPALLLLSHSSVFFAWAKPVPVNPYNFRRPRHDDMVVSFAGPLSNMILALGFTAVLALVVLTPFGSRPEFWQSPYFNVLHYGIWINLVLAFFNLIPIPPLDGSHILANLLPRQAALRYERIRPYGFLILIAAMYFGLLSVFFLPAKFIFTGLMNLVVRIGTSAL